ncbi:NAD(P)H-binding protein [Streptomyces sp. NPDC059679]|uniref:NAD(P)H-binding protein n=1 Tax=Streptomyces sp. NPDC059679 TaxID=3346903 RepID=UPI0036D0B571
MGASRSARSASSCRTSAGFADHTALDQAVRATSGIDWTLARAVALTDKPLSGPVRAAEADTEKPGARINRADEHDQPERGLPPWTAARRGRRTSLAWSPRSSEKSPQHPDGSAISSSPTC